MVKKRYGKIMVTESLYRQFWEDIPIKIIPHRVEYLVTRRSYEIVGECEAFDLLEEYEVLPEYILETTEVLVSPKLHDGKSVLKLITGVSRLKW